jgi:hypothetical protein
VALLRRLGVAGVVAGHNYRFGFRAAGDAASLRSLCAAQGLSAHIVDMVTAADGAPPPPQEGPACALQVSSTRVRAALASGDVSEAAALLGRPHRLVLCAPAADVDNEGALGFGAGAARNQPPRGERSYDADAAALELRDASGALLWAAGAQERGACVLQPLPGGGARLALRGGEAAAAAARALREAPPGAALRAALDL